MDTVFTIDDWGDGPLLGIATYKSQMCIYEQIFSAEKDMYINQYYLTPISNKEAAKISNNWQEWLQWMAFDKSLERAMQWHKNGKYLDLKKIAKASSNYQQYIKCAKFYGICPHDFCSAIAHYYVLWEVLDS